MDQQKKSPRKRRRLTRENPETQPHVVEIDNDVEEGQATNSVTTPSITFEQLTREHDVRFYTGFINGDIFKTLFNHLSFRASTMRYWDGAKRTSESSSYCILKG